MTSTVLAATGGKLIRGSDRCRFSGVSIDSRTVQEGELFVAIRGDRFDGHSFSESVLEKGAAGMVVRDGWKPPRESRFDAPGNQADLIAVPDTLRALQDLAHHYRMTFAIPVVAVTGTNGKTSTKEMIYAILNMGIRAFRSPGNLNNHIGVPLSLLKMGRETEAAVLEFGMSAAGEIRRLREIARPTVVVITNVSAGHMTQLKTLEAVARAKGEILEDLTAEGWAVLNRDDPRVMALRQEVQGKILTFGFSPEADVTADEIEILGEGGSRFSLSMGNERKTVRLSRPGKHQIANALAAAAVARALGRPMAHIVQGLETCDFPAMRWETTVLPNGAVVINDAYNANPGSVAAAIGTLEGLGGARRNIVVLGDMLELGAQSELLHREVGCLVATSGIASLVTVGDQARRIGEGALKCGMTEDQIICCHDWLEAVCALKALVGAHDRILVKASRGAGLERVVEALKEGS
ncbi:MAG: UDP-N-acetylmuramoyl-tripeptide--D-alanyl-D-alanine ligase [bacterium]|nr:UDP-N-acetylmuramoyl-tripeptide--D-alanyl-D-alanine ligase [bacterium]